MILTVLTSSLWEKTGWVEKKMREEGEWKEQSDDRGRVGKEGEKEN